jgi:hypothetical protein
MSSTLADLEHSCWSRDYLIAHCEGFRVESDEGTLGYVEEIVAEPLALRVRSGSGDQDVVTIAIEDATELHPDGERIVVRGTSEKRKP